MNHSLAAIAERIQGRNDALRSELITLDLLQSQLNNATQLLEVEELAHSSSRRELLASLQSAHEIELEALKLADAVRAIDDSSLASLREDATSMRDKTRALERLFDAEHAPVYARHDLSTKLYVAKIGSILDAARSRKRRREERLSSLAADVDRMRDDAEAMRNECERIIEKWKELDEREEEEDEEMVALGMQIKSVLAKVSYEEDCA